MLEKYNIILSSDKNILFVIGQNTPQFGFLVNPNNLEKSIDRIIGRNFEFFRQIAHSNRRSKVPNQLKEQYTELPPTDLSYLNSRLLSLYPKQQQI